MTQPQYTNHDQLGRGTWTPVAGFWTRVAARLIDDVAQLLAMLPYLIGLLMLIDAQGGFENVLTGNIDPNRPVDTVTVLIGVGLMGLGGLLGLGFAIWNRVVQQGRTGQSIGKAAVGIVLVSARTGQPIGAGSAFLREIVHNIVDGIIYIGYLWPLWDRRKQTWGDKICGTVVAKDTRQVQSDEPTWAQRALL